MTTPGYDHTNDQLLPVDLRSARDDTNLLIGRKIEAAYSRAARRMSGCLWQFVGDDLIRVHNGTSDDAH